MRSPTVPHRKCEHCRHPHGIDRDERLLLRLYAKSSAFCWSGEHRQQAGRVDCADEEHAKKSSPLPRKTVENRRSSMLPSCSRTTPMNHRKAIPAMARGEAQLDEVSSLRIRLECLEATSPTRQCGSSSGPPGGARGHDPRNRGRPAASHRRAVREAHWCSHRLNLRCRMTACCPLRTPVGYRLLVSTRSEPA